MTRLSLNPDPHIAWIYDTTHKNYNSDIAQDLRNSRTAAIASAPKWMVFEAQLNDTLSALEEK